MPQRAFFTALAAVATLVSFARTVPAAISLSPIGTYATGVPFDGDKGAAEIPAYDWLTKRLFVVNAIEQQIDVFDLSDPATPTKLFDIDVSAFGTPNNVDTRIGLVAVAIESPVKTDPGKVAFYRPTPPLVQGPPVPTAPTPTCPRLASASPAPPASTPFNSNSEEAPSFDTRSDNKGPEPEGVVVGEHLGRTYAFVGLERVGGIVVYDVTKPASPRFQTYVNPRDFSAEYELPDEPGDIGAAGDVGPEGLAFIPFFQSPNGRALLVAANEVSGTTTVYQLTGFPF